MMSRRLIEFTILFAWLAVGPLTNPACAIQTQEVDIGRNGVYDGVVKIVRDERGRMTLCDAETSPVTLSDLRFNGIAHWLLLGLDGDDHPQYLNTTRARQALSAQSPLTYSSSSGVFAIDSATTPTFRGLALSGLPTGAIPYTAAGGKIAADGARLSILESGYVGIGTNAPAAKLDVMTSGTGYMPGGQIRGGIDPGVGATRFMLNNPQSSFVMSAYGSGAPGILANSAGLSAGPGSGGSFIICSSAGRPIRMFANNQYTSGNHIVVDTTGYIGVGTETPSVRLDVNGAARIRGTLAIDGVTTSAALNVAGAVRLAPEVQAVTTDTQTLACSRGLAILDPIGNRNLVSCPTIAPGAAGQILVITNLDPNEYVRVSSEALLVGSKLALGSSARTLYLHDTLTLMYVGDRWCELGFCSNH